MNDPVTRQLPQPVAPWKAIVPALCIFVVILLLVFSRVLDNSKAESEPTFNPRDAEWVEFFKAIPEDLSSLGYRKLVSISGALSTFDYEYKTYEDDTYTGEKIIPQSQFAFVKNAVNLHLRAYEINEYMQDFPDGLVPDDESKNRESFAREELGDPLLPEFKTYLLSYHAKQLEYALLYLYYFPSYDVDRWTEVRDLVARVAYERAQTGNAIPTQEIYKFGPPTMEEAQYLRDLAYKRLLLQCLKDLRAEKFTYPESTRTVDAFIALMSESPYDLRSLGTTIEEVEKLRFRDPDLPGVKKVQSKTKTSKGQEFEEGRHRCGKFKCVIEKRKPGSGWGLGFSGTGRNDDDNPLYNIEAQPADEEPLDDGSQIYTGEEPVSTP
ncbi:MAG: hypothetical protein UT02_C0048G0014 [Parcubacteria group bacterium GW2011_GWC2_38_7]|nr:MAG: hypothetical protein UT02_C0048G0014 [Parcubacteria group bacterium GW2011_GWC2_38_7]